MEQTQMEKNNNLTLVTLVISLVSLVLVAYLAFFGVSQELTKMEAMKVGGMDNYALVQKIYSSAEFKKTQADSLQQAVSQFNGGAAVDGTTPPTDGTTPTAPTDGTTPTVPTANAQPGADGFTRGTLTEDQIDQVTKDAQYKGENWADIVLVEYSDVECPFCQRHHTSKTVDNVISKYPDAVKSTYKHFPLSFHPEAQKAAEAIECAGKQGKYLEFKDAAFDAAVAGGGKPTKELMATTAEKLGLDKEDFTKCVESGETAAKVTADMNEGSSLFGVTGTPGNVLLNTKTGKYVVIAGAYPADQFDAVVAELK